MRFSRLHSSRNTRILHVVINGALDALVTWSETWEPLSCQRTAARRLMANLVKALGLFHPRATNLVARFCKRGVVGHLQVA
jgi:hypothetical protein